MIQAGEATVSAHDHGSESAARTLVSGAMDDIDDVEPAFGILFCSTAFDIPAFINAVDDRLSQHDVDWVGCTTAGEISAQGGTQGGAVLLLVGGDDIDTSVGTVSGIHDDPETAGREAAEAALNALPDTDDRHELLFPLVAGRTVTEEPVAFDVLQGIVREAADTPIVGGVAADDYRLTGTYQFHNGKVYDDTVVLTGISSPYPIHTGKEHGLHQKITSGVVNTADGSVVDTISGKPAAAFYADAIGVPLWKLKLPILPICHVPLKAVLRYIRLVLTGKADMMLQRVFRYSLQYSIAVEVEPSDYRVITPLAVTRNDGLLMRSPIQENQSIHIMEGDHDDVINAGAAAFDHIDTENERPVFGVVTDCVSRNILFSAAERDDAFAALQETLACPVIGFYSYGEIGGTDEHLCTVQNQTVSGFVITVPDDTADAES